MQIALADGSFAASPFKLAERQQYAVERHFGGIRNVRSLGPRLMAARLAGQPLADCRQSGPVLGQPQPRHKLHRRNHRQRASADRKFLQRIGHRSEYPSECAFVCSKSGVLDVDYNWIKNELNDAAALDGFELSHSPPDGLSRSFPFVTFVNNWARRDFYIQTFRVYGVARGMSGWRSERESCDGKSGINIAECAVGRLH